MLETCYQYERIEAGCDEAGRGCLAGAVFAAAVILPPDFHDPLLNDSKQMSERNRDRLRPIIEREAVAWAVAAVPPERIDEINILNASFEGMCRAVGELRTRPEFLAIDGNRFRSSLDIPYRCIVKGDGKYADIAADAEREWQRIDSTYTFTFYPHVSVGWDNSPRTGSSPVVRNNTPDAFAEALRKARSYADSHPDALGGFAAVPAGETLSVSIPPALLAQVPAERQEALRGVLAQDPRPHYQKDPERVYGFSFAGFEVRFTVDGNQLTVRDIRPAE